MTKAIIYTTPTCHYCKMTKAFFKENDVDFEEKDVSSDQEALKEMIDKSGQMGVPVTLIGENVIVGFNKHALEHVLEEEK